MTDKKITITPIENHRTDTPGLASRCGPVRHANPIEMALSDHPNDVRAITLIHMQTSHQRIQGIREYWDIRGRGETTDDPRLLAAREASHIRELTRYLLAQESLHGEYDDVLESDNPLLEEVLIDGDDCDYMNQRWAKLWLGLILGTANVR